MQGLYFGLHWDDGKENGKYYFGFRVQGLGFRLSGRGRYEQELIPGM